MLPVGCVRRLAKNAGRSAVLPDAHVLLDVGVEILDEHLAAERLAEERQVRPDDRAEIEQHRSVLRLERAQELAERLRAVAAGASQRGRGDSIRSRRRIGSVRRPATPQARQEPGETAARLVRQLDSSRAAGCRTAAAPPSVVAARSRRRPSGCCGAGAGLLGLRVGLRLGPDRP